jgi:queuine tRNA-ribosyltransferase
MVTVNASPIAFELIRRDERTLARRGRLAMRRVVVETPAFMPVGTQATVKTLRPEEVWETGARICLANTYHLMLRPGPDIIEQAGGLHRFMAWDGAILTDSGGFQLFSLAQQTRVREEGVTFQSHIDGSRHELTPERAVDLQLRYGTDIAMAFDQLIGLPAKRAKIADAMARTHRWLDRCIAEYHRLGGEERGTALFGIVQGGMEADLRRESAQYIAAADVAGCAVGGLSVGEPKDVMAAILEVVMPELPADKPRYLMGVGSPEDLWSGVARGVDLFDCVLPTRLARNAALFTPFGRVNLRSRRFREEFGPVDPTCDCATCRTFTAAYLHHLFRAGEVLALRLASVPNLRFLARQMETIRAALDDGTFPEVMRRFEDQYRPVAAVSDEA